MELQTGTSILWNKFVCTRLYNSPLDNALFYQFIPRPLSVLKSPIFVTHGVTDRSPHCAEFNWLAQGSKMHLWTFPSFITLSPDQSFYEKVRCLSKVELQTRMHNGLKFSTNHFLILSHCFQSTSGLKLSFSSFLPLFSDHSLRKSIFLYELSCRRTSYVISWLWNDFADMV